MAVIAILFGIATIAAGGRTLFDAETRRLAGNYVPYVLWFNFVVGFAYVVAGVGLWRQQSWSVWLSFAIFAATLVVGTSFGLRVWSGGSFEMRTVAAMIARVVIWLVIAGVAYVQLPSPRYRTGT
jgi:hypothetical protein